MTTLETLIRRLNLSYFELGDEDKRGDVAGMHEGMRHADYPTAQDVFDVLDALREEMIR